jgi:hypothetical protein
MTAEMGKFSNRMELLDFPDGRKTQKRTGSYRIGAAYSRWQLGATCTSTHGIDVS